MTEIDLMSSETRAALRLSLTSGVGPKLFGELIQAFGSAEQVLAAAPPDLHRVPGVGKKVVEAIVMSQRDVDIDSLLRLCRDSDLKLLTRAQDSYPRSLAEIHDPPNFLFYTGQLTPADEIAIAIVGSRHASRYGVEQAERLARGLANSGITVISGLARGIDQAAHQGALAAGGRTLAVLGSGLLNVYPPENEGLACKIAEQGAVLSELHPLHPPRGSSFPQRNRIVTGLSLGVVVVEAAERSGALISARLAAEQGREVFAVPGRVDSRLSRGCHRLIRDGAKLIESVDDILEELGPLVAPVARGTEQVVRHPAELKLNEQETQVLQAITSEPTSMEEIVVASGLPIHRVLSTISVLEIRHLIRRISGNTVARI